MNILCATNMPFAREAFATLGTVTIREGRAISPDDAREADLLAIRSTTRVGPALLDHSRARFVGTATIGTDHLDIPYLESRGIPWAFAPGCNAESVADYLCAALLHLAQRHGFRLAGKTIAIIGVGNVGSRVAARALALGMRPLLHDPPRQRRAAATAADGVTTDPPLPLTPDWLTLDAALAQADIVTLHVPLTASGPDATRHLANDAFFARLKPGAIFVNAARGAITDSEALRRAVETGRVAHAVLDTWEGEPAFRADLLPVVALATPHIAGYSYEGRVNGTVMIYRAACRLLQRPADWSPDALLPPPAVPRLELTAGDRDDEAVLAEAVRAVYDISADDQRLRAAADPDDRARAAAFDHLRKHYPERREFTATRVALAKATPALRIALAGLGFQLEPPA